MNTKQQTPSKYNITHKWESTRVMYLDTIEMVDVTRTDQVEALEREEFTVVINMLQKMPLQFDWLDFYLDIEDVEANQKQLDKMSDMMVGLDEKEDKEEIKKIMEEHYIQHIIRQKVCIESNKDLVKMVNDFIEKHNV